mmetsp:Transcript_70388/g.139632  ORF Transcript_70388/g.139632 Transcript_70388/m.139632 type:complete len:393 (+) Transcript_70388:61-1239(+)
MLNPMLQQGLLLLAGACVILSEETVPAACIGGSASCPAVEEQSCIDSGDGKPLRRKAFITGVTGMIGSFIARELVRDPCVEVFGLVRWRSNLRNLGGILGRIRLVHGDLSDAFRMRDIIREVLPDRIYHFGGQAINNVGFDSPQYTLQVNIIGTLNLLEAVREVEDLRRQCKILLAGSSTEYGQTADHWGGTPIPETAPLLPVSPYGVSKVSAEMLARQYFLAYGIQAIIARIFIHVAPGGTEHLAIQEFSRQVAMIEQGLQAPVIRHGNLETSRDMTDIRDSAPVMVALLEKGEPGEAYNVGSNILYVTKLILDLILEQCTVRVRTEVDPSRFRKYDEKILRANISKLTGLTGWVPNPNMRRTVTDVLNYWRQEVMLRHPPGEKLEEKAVT